MDTRCYSHLRQLFMNHAVLPPRLGVSCCPLPWHENLLKFGGWLQLPNVGDFWQLENEQFLGCFPAVVLRGCCGKGIAVVLFQRRIVFPVFIAVIIVVTLGSLIKSIYESMWQITFAQGTKKFRHIQDRQTDIETQTVEAFSKVKIRVSWSVGRSPELF